MHTVLYLSVGIEKFPSTSNVTFKYDLIQVFEPLCDIAIVKHRQNFNHTEEDNASSCQNYLPNKHIGKHINK